MLRTCIYVRNESYAYDIDMAKAYARLHVAVKQFLNIDIPLHVLRDMETLLEEKLCQNYCLASEM